MPATLVHKIKLAQKAFEIKSAAHNHSTENIYTNRTRSSLLISNQNITEPTQR